MDAERLGHVRNPTVPPRDRHDRGREQRRHVPVDGVQHHQLGHQLKGQRPGFFAAQGLQPPRLDRRRQRQHVATVKSSAGEGASSTPRYRQVRLPEGMHALCDARAGPVNTLEGVPRSHLPFVTPGMTFVTASSSASGMEPEARSPRPRAYNLRRDGFTPKGQERRARGFLDATSCAAGVRTCAGRPDPGRAAVWLRAVLIVVAGIIAYANSLALALFRARRSGLIVMNEQIRQLSPSVVLFPAVELPVAGRPVVNVSFALNYALGGLAVGGYHAVNIALHIASALLLFGIVRRTLELVASRPEVSAGTWSSVALQRGLPATNLAFADGHHLARPSAPDRRHRLHHAAHRAGDGTVLSAHVLRGHPRSPHGTLDGSSPAVVSCALGMASKESTATAPFLVVVTYDRIFVFDSFQEAWRWRSLFSIVCRRRVAGAGSGGVVRSPFQVRRLFGGDQRVDVSAQSDADDSAVSATGCLARRARGGLRHAPRDLWLGDVVPQAVLVLVFDCADGAGSRAEADDWLPGSVVLHGTLT